MSPVNRPYAAADSEQRQGCSCNGAIPPVTDSNRVAPAAGLEPVSQNTPHRVRHRCLQVPIRDTSKHSPRIVSYERTLRARVLVGPPCRAGVSYCA